MSAPRQKCRGDVLNRLPAYEDFKANFDSTFTVNTNGDEAISLELIAVNDLRQHAGQKEQPFSLIFLQKNKDTLLTQQIHEFTHEKLGSFQIFIVPIGSEENGFLYEAIFS